MRRQTILAFLAGALLAGSPAAGVAQAKSGQMKSERTKTAQAKAEQTRTGQAAKDEFFIISSFNMQKHELVLKLPTEVTLRMSVTDKTSIVDEHGKRLRASDLRAGDTVYITYKQNGTGAQALHIRLGPMTVEELHRRYLKNEAMPARPTAARKTSTPGARAQTSRGKR